MDKKQPLNQNFDLHAYIKTKLIQDEHNREYIAWKKHLSAQLNNKISYKWIPVPGDPHSWDRIEYYDDRYQIHLKNFSDTPSSWQFDTIDTYKEVV